MATAYEENRIKLLSINQHFLIDVLNWWRDPPAWMALPITDQLPADCYVVNVSVSWERRCVEAMVCSREFPVVPEGCALERIPGHVSKFRKVEMSVFNPLSPVAKVG